MNFEAIVNLEAILTERFSCRGFLPEPVPREILERIFELGQFTPSWCNTQPWNGVVCEGSATVAFAEALCMHATKSATDSDLPMPPKYEGVHRDRRREAGWALYDAVGVARGDRTAGQRQALRNYEFFGAPTVVVVTAPRNLGVYAAVDCGLYIQTLLLAATALGVASIAQASLANFSSFVRKYLGISEDRIVVCGVSLGYADPNHPANSFRTKRESIDASVKWCQNPN
jgi:nitroreductase